MARLIARDKYLFDGDEKFYARGVSYGPFAPNSRGERYPEPDAAAADFALMRELGASVVRVYVPPPDWLFELARRNRLRVMVGIPWPFHMMFLDSTAMQREIRATVRQAVAQMREFRDVIFAYSLGNEIRSDVARWHGPRKISRFLAELYEIGKDLDPDGLFTYSNYPSVEYLDLSFLDLICFNVYLHRPVDYRRYLTHLLALSGPLPLVLSETGMDTIREGQAHQAELLQWQARAAFELGLSGFIIFAFTDAWHTGGAEITDWAFGLVTRERERKQSFASVAQVFNEPLPPVLAAPPRVSVIVAAYNAAATLPACLDSLKRLRYPDFEIIVVDDGSSDRTREIAAQAAARVVGGAHLGLGAARNLGVQAAGGELIAFIDADAVADPDWLYHLAETLVRREADAVGGPNFAPVYRGPTQAALAAAPGLPREVKLNEDSLAQLCGCNMAIRKSTLIALGGFEPAFESAGDDTDISLRLLERGATIAYAPAAVVIHERRATLAAYLAQQAGYGRGEALLARKYPGRDSRVYAAGDWRSRILGQPRIYYGAFGRGLFQSLYHDSAEPLVQTPLSVVWIVVALGLLLLGVANPPLALLGLAGLGLSIAAALTYAARAPLPSRRRGFGLRARLALASFCGPLRRSKAYWEEWLKAALAGPAGAKGHLKAGGELDLPLDPPPEGPRSVPPAAQRDALVEGLHRELFRRGLTVALSKGFDSFDLLVWAGPLALVPVNVICSERHLRLRWRLRPNWPRLGGLAALLILLAAWVSWPAARGAGPLGLLGGLILIVVGGLIVILGVVSTLAVAKRLDATLDQALRVAARELGVTADSAEAC